MVPSETKLLNILSNNDVTFFIPPYQRNYEWSSSQCEVFLDDVYKTAELNMAGTTAEHFFGTITYFQTEAVFGQPNKLVLIDGQQRITTTMLFLVALRDILQDENIRCFIDSKYLKNNNVHGDSEYKIKLKQVETDWAAFKKIILCEELDGREENSAISHNYKYFLNKLTDYQKSGGNINALIEKGLSRFSVITIQLEPDRNAWENPQEIFESMNSLGKPLSLADLVRNYLFLGLDPDAQSALYSHYWLHIEQVVPNRVSDFVRDYMQERERKSFPVARESNYKELYSSFKRIFVDKDAEMLLKDLSEMSTLYCRIIGGMSTGRKEIDALLKDINAMGVSTAYSFLLALFRAWRDDKFTVEDVRDILDAFKIYCMRRRIIGIASAENKNFPLLANHLHELEAADNKKEKMFRILANQENNLRIPNDIEIYRHMETMNFYNFRYAKLYLALIEEKLTKSRPDLSDKNLEVEHIMPRTLSEKWKEAIGDNYDSIHQEYVNTIGNLTLIRHNQTLSNKPFAQKKKLYEENSGLQIARAHITNKENWNETAIKERTGWIVDFLLTEVLPIPDDMRRTNNFKTKPGKAFSFLDLQIIGEDITFIDDPSVVARVVTDKEVEFEGKRWRLSPLTREIQTRRGRVNASGAYQGAQYWAYDGIKLADFM